MKKTWPLFQILLLSSIVIAIAAVLVTVVMTNTTLRSVERNLPNTLIKELVSLDLVLEHLSEVVSSAEIAAVNANPATFDRLKEKVSTAFDSVASLRHDYVFDNLIQASEFHTIVAPAITDLQIWLTEGISGYEPVSETTAKIILSRISTSFQKAKALNRQSRLNAQNKLNEERKRLDGFLSSVNLLFLLTLFITIIMIFLFIRLHLLQIRELQAEKALQASEEQYRAVVESTPDLLYRTDMNGIIVFVSHSVLRLSGYTVEEALGMKMAEEVYAYPEERQGFLEKLKKEGSIRNYEARLKRKDGSIWWASTNAHFYKDADGNLMGVEGITRDITDTKHAEAALKESEERFKIAGRASYDLIYEWDVKTDSLRWFGNIDSLLGFGEGEISDNIAAWLDLIHPEDKPLLENAVEHHRTATNPIRYEYRIKQKDGSWKYWTDHALPLLGEDNLPFKWIGVCTDITPRKQNEQALRESEQRMRAILEASPDPMVMYDRGGYPLYINPSFTEVFGWTLEDLADKHIPFVPEDQVQLTAEKINEIYTHGKPLKFETKRYTKDHRTLDIFLSAAVTRGHEGEPAGLVVNLTDISERKNLEAQYERAQKMESLGTLAGGIAHDFNNLLSGIFGYLDLARKLSQEPKIKEYLTKAFNTSERAKGLTHQLLTFSKGGAPVKKIEPLVPFIQETTQFALSGSNVSCGFEIPHDLWMCNYDKNQIGQVIDNIVINAHHATPTGGNIRVTAANTVVMEHEHPALNAGIYVKISITDRGTGIPKKFISRIFDPFFTTKQKGCGLGLATSYSMVKRHKGIIDDESETGVGSTFHIYLPAIEHHRMQEKTMGENCYLGSGKILIMGDERDDPRKCSRTCSKPWDFQPQKPAQATRP